MHSKHRAREQVAGISGRRVPKSESEGHIFTIGSLAARARMSTDSIRFYERGGLISPAARTAARYRLYTQDALRRLSFIKHAQRCGMSLAEIKALLDITDGDRDKVRVDAACQLARTKAAEIALTIAALHAMSDALSCLLSWYSNDAESAAHQECALLRAFESAMAKHE